MIALDSPFLAEPSQPHVTGAESSATVDFESIWESLKDQLNARGWCQSGIEKLEQRIQGISTYKVTIVSPDVLQGTRSYIHERGSPTESPTTLISLRGHEIGIIVSR